MLCPETGMITDSFDSQQTKKQDLHAVHKRVTYRQELLDQQVIQGRLVLV